MKRIVSIATAAAIALIVVPGVLADEPFERFRVSAEREQVIERFPENLQSGFEAIWEALEAMGQSEERILEMFDGFVALNFIRINVIERGLEQIPFPNQDVTYAEFYAEFRALAIANAIHILPAIIVLGNPFGTDWEWWFTDIEAFL